MFKKIFGAKQTRQDIDVTHFKKLLKSELSRLENELKTVGRKNPKVSGEWETRSTDVNIEAADDADIADNMENYENNNAILAQLDVDYGDTKRALAKIKEGTYGMCEICGKPIEIGRLEANPSARTCIVHKDTKLG